MYVSSLLGGPGKSCVRGGGEGGSVLKDTTGAACAPYLATSHCVRLPETSHRHLNAGDGEIVSKEVGDSEEERGA